MDSHEYTPEQALTILMGQLRAKDETLAELAQEAIDAGKDILVDSMSQITSRIDFEPVEFQEARSQRRRQYWQTVTLTHPEALQVALKVLKSYFVEQPLLQNYIVATLQRRIDTQESTDKQIELIDDSLSEEKYQDLVLKIDFQMDTQIDSSDENIFYIETIKKEQIDEQHHNLDKLAELFDFQER